MRLYNLKNKILFILNWAIDNFFIIKNVMMKLRRSVSAGTIFPTRRSTPNLSGVFVRRMHSMWNKLWWTEACPRTFEAHWNESVWELPYSRWTFIFMWPELSVVLMNPSSVWLFFGGQDNHKLSYIQQLRPTQTVQPRIKLKLFGHTGAGKSSLLESLKCGILRSFFRRRRTTRMTNTARHPNSPINSKPPGRWQTALVKLV